MGGGFKKAKTLIRYGGDGIVRDFQKIHNRSVIVQLESKSINHDKYRTERSYT